MGRHVLIIDHTMDVVRRSLRRRRFGPSLLALLADVILLLSSIIAAWQLRATLPWFDEAGDVDYFARSAVGPMALTWILLLAVLGTYSPAGMGAGTSEYRRVLVASLSTAGGIGIGCYLLRFPLSRGLFFLAFTVGIPALLLGRLLVRRTVQRLHERGALLQRVVLVGGPRQVKEVAAVLAREKWLGYRVVGVVLPPDDEGLTRVGPLPVLGTTPRLEALAHDWRPDIVMFAGGAVGSAAQMRRAAWELEPTGVRIMLVPSLTDVAAERIRLRPAGGLSMMEVDGPSTRWRSAVLKRAFDVVGAGALIVIGAPLLIVTALAVKLYDSGPVLFRQTRSGRDGVPFSCLKFRSMIEGADRLQGDVLNHHGDDHVLFKSKDDPRITPPGRFIRRFSLDELPQLFNVLEGSMSLVGPRPPLPSEVARYESDVHRRLSVRPGMTGLWQVSGRSDLSWDDTVRLDLYYVDNWSIVRDMVILLRTAHAVFSRRGAY